MRELYDEDPASRVDRESCVGDPRGRRPPAAEPCIALDTSIHPAASQKAERNIGHPISVSHWPGSSASRKPMR